MCPSVETLTATAESRRKCRTGQLEEGNAGLTAAGGWRVEAWRKDDFTLFMWPRFDTNNLFRYMTYSLQISTAFVRLFAFDGYVQPTKQENKFQYKQDTYFND